MYLIGIDLGTSAVKLLLMRENGEIVRIENREYPISFPQPGWSEQRPEDWWKGVVDGIRALTEGIPKGEIGGIGGGGQMHGLVTLDSENHVIRPAILWNDGRSQEEVLYLNETIGRDRISSWTGNIAFAGFTAPKILWMRKHEPENFRRIAHILLPKDYINFRLTGRYVTDYSDAGGMLLLDVKNKKWSADMLSICGITEEELPELHESTDAVGTLTRAAAEELGLSEQTVCAAGAGDNAAAAVGCGAVGSGKCNISLGTSGTIFVTSSHFTMDPGNALHSFAHADGGFHQMGCILSAASCNRWWMEEVLRTKEYAAEQELIPPELPGKNDVYFLPYLMGERSPHNDPLARGAFLGLRMDVGRAEMTLAVLEGVAFAMRDCLESARAQGIAPDSSTICGGGAKSPLWRQIMADVTGLSMKLPETEQGPGLGGAMLASVAAGCYPDIQTCADHLVRIRSVTTPEPERQKLYEEKYKIWHQLYPALKPEFARMSQK